MASGGDTFEPDPEDLPPPLDSISSCRLATAWVFRQQVAGRMDPRMADSFNTTIKSFVTALRTDHGLNEMDKYHALVDRFERASNRIAEGAERERYASTSSTTPSLGRTRERVSPPDGETPH